MNLKISKEIKIALLAIVSILLFIFGFNYLKGSGVFSSSKIVKAEYDNVQGITASSFVQLQGFNVGSVSKVSLSKEHPGKILVEMNVDKNLVIPEDTKAQIVSLDLLGTKAVSLIKGTSPNPLKEGQMLAGSIELGTIESLGASAGPAIDNAKMTIASLDTTIRSINNILDVTTQQNLKHTIANLNSTMGDFQQFANALNAQSAKINSLLNNLSAFSANLEKNNTKISNVLTNAETTTSNLSKVNFDATVSELKNTLQDLQKTLEKVNNGTGSIAMLMNDDKLYKNLKNTLATANNLLYDINARPSRYIHVSVFGKKNKDEAPSQPAPNSKD
jgi:phospholipid/cholesterol/gamma-HCH transport system substrate-binding protein